MKNVKKQLAWFLSMLMVITLILSTGITESSAKKTVRLRKIVLNHSTLNLPKGKKLKLKASFKPKNTTQKKLKWKSSKKSVAKVSKKGVVKALKIGKAKITVTVMGTRKKAACKVKVINNDDASLNQTLNSDSVQTNAPTATPPATGGNQPPVTLPTPGASNEPTMNPTNNPTDNPTDAPTTNPTDNPTDTQTPTQTSKPTDTPAPTQTSKPTDTPAPTRTSKPTDTPAPTQTSKPTDTPAPTQTSKPTGTPAPTQTSKPTDTPAPTQTSKPTGTPAPTQTSKPTDTPAPTPKYERPSETALPVNNIDFTANGAVHNESPDGASIVNNDDGSITVKFTKQYAALNFYLPDNAQIYYSDYKSVVLKYTSEGGNLNYALYDTNMEGSSEQNAGKHAYWDGKIVPTPTEKMLTFNVTKDCVGGCIRGFQIFNPNKMENGSSITITIKSLTFCDKENPTESDLNPTPAPTATATPDLSTPTPIPTPNKFGLMAPYTDGNNLIWNCINLGSYYQSEYTPKQPPQNPVNGSQYTDSDNTNMIYQDGKYYKSSPIKWRILSLDGSKALLIADNILDSRRFNDDNCSSITWEDSSLRQWLNTDFYSAAFTDDEKSSIISTGADKLYLLSADDVINKDYGFSLHCDNNSITRQAKNTDYAKAAGAWTNDGAEYAGNGWWWLRSSGSMPYDVTYVSSEGCANLTDGYIAVNDGGGIRPVMLVDLDNETWTEAESVTIEAASHLQPTPAPTENPVKQVALSGTQFVPSEIGSYDIDSDTITINDTRTGDGVTFINIPLPMTVSPGQTLSVTITGPKWGTNDFRIWTTPNGEDSGDYVDNNQLFLRPTINTTDNSFTGTVEVVTKGKDCKYLTLKAGWDVKIKDLVISDIRVSIVKS